jgi:hypothetical protein
MAQTVLATVLQRVREEGRLVDIVDGAPIERPPMAGLRVA